MDNSDPTWSKFYRRLFPIRNSCRDITETIVTKDIRTVSNGKFLALLGMILSMAKGGLQLLHLFLLWKLTTGKRMYKMGIFFTSWIFALICITHYMKLGIHQHTKFMNTLHSRKCSDD